MNESDCAVFFEELRKEFEEQRLDFPWDIGIVRDSLARNGLYVVMENSPRGERKPGTPWALILEGGWSQGATYVSDLQEMVSYIAYRLFMSSGFLPESVHSRMVIGGLNNHWVREYFSRKGR